MDDILIVSRPLNKDLAVSRTCEVIQLRIGNMKDKNGRQVSSVETDTFGII
jgi:hypothetical protein